METNQLRTSSSILYADLLATIKQNDILLLVSPMHWSVCICKCASVDIACAHFAYRIAFNALIFQAATKNTVHNTHLSNLILHKLFMLINLCCDQMVFLWISLVSAVHSNKCWWILFSQKISKILISNNFLNSCVSKAFTYILVIRNIFKMKIWQKRDSLALARNSISVRHSYETEKLTLN